MNFLKLSMIIVGICFSASLVYADFLNEGKKSFKLVLDDIYNEMGQPEMTEKVAENMDRLIFSRDISKKPAFSTKVNISWSSYKNSITAVISRVENGQPVKVRVLWRSDQELEILNPDLILKW